MGPRPSPATLLRPHRTQPEPIASLMPWRSSIACRTGTSAHFTDSHSSDRHAGAPCASWRILGHGEGDGSHGPAPGWPSMRCQRQDPQAVQTRLQKLGCPQRGPSASTERLHKRLRVQEPLSLRGTVLTAPRSPPPLPACLSLAVRGRKGWVWPHRPAWSPRGASSPETPE